MKRFKIYLLVLMTAACLTLAGCHSSSSTTTTPSGNTRASDADEDVPDKPDLDSSSSDSSSPQAAKLPFIAPVATINGHAHGEGDERPQDEYVCDELRRSFLMRLQSSPNPSDRQIVYTATDCQLQYSSTGSDDYEVHVIMDFTMDHGTQSEPSRVTRELIADFKWEGQYWHNDPNVPILSVIEPAGLHVQFSNQPQRFTTNPHPHWPSNWDSTVINNFQAPDTVQN